MTFLNPFVLFGLFAAAIPILIHLLNKRKLRTVDFSTLTFLKELQKNTMRKITLRQWLLLLLRTLLVIFLVIAFSRPALKGNFGSIGAHAASSIVIIIDNTASMELHNERGKFLEQAKEQALQIVAMMQNNDDAVVIRLADLPAMTTPLPTHDMQKLQSVIQETAVEVKHRNVLEGLRTAASVMQESRNANKEIYVLTDGQTSTIAGGDVTNPPQEVLFSPEVKLFFTALSDEPVENAGIERITFPPTLLQAKKPLPVIAVVKNHGSQRLENHLVGISVGPVRTMQKSVTLDPGESGTVEFLITPPQPGFISGSIELEEDEFEADDTKYFSLYIPGQAKVTLIAEGESTARYIGTALKAANTLSSSEMVHLQQILPAQISTSVLGGTDVAILSGIRQISETQERLLQQYVRNGGNLIFFPGSDSAASHYRYLHAFGVPVSGVLTAPAQTFFRFGKSDLDFPVFSGMFESRQKEDRTLESPDIARTVSMSPQKNIREIITLTNGTPFLWLREFHKGKILGFSVPATGDWSDFPLKGIFVPILYQSILYLASQEQLEPLSKEYIAGENIEFTSAQLRRTKQSAASPSRIVDPENRFFPLQSYSKTTSDGVTQTIFTGANLPAQGQYFILSGRDTVGALSANIDRAESPTEIVTAERISEIGESLGIESGSITILPPGSPVQEAVLQSRFGVELWRYFAFLAMLAGLIEMIVAREKKEP